MSFVFDSEPPGVIEVKAELPIYAASRAPERISVLFCSGRTRMRGLGVFFDSLLLSDVVVWWWLAVDVSPPIACHGGTVAVLFGLRRMLNSMVNARDSRFILVQALDRRSSNDPTSSRRLPFALD